MDCSPASPTPHPDSCIALLLSQLARIEAKMLALLDCSTVEAPRSHPNLIIVSPGNGNCWGDPDERQRRLQIEIKTIYSPWAEQLRLLFSGATTDIQAQLAEVDEFTRAWIEKEPSGDIELDMEANKATFRSRVQVFRQALALLDDPGRSKVAIVPDTNAFADCPDPTRYGALAGRDTFDFVLLPTVLGELDTLARTARQESFREKVKAASRRYKGWRQQGRLLDGVTVSRTITVRTVAREPNFAKTLHWLDPTSKDDRIVASVLELQRAMPAAAVVLVTGDMNLHNKADAASIPCADTPTAEAP